MRRFLLRTERMGATTRAKEVLRRSQREKGGISGLLPLRLRSKLSAMMVTIGLGIVAVCDVAECNCTFHIFAGKDSLVFPFHKDLNIRGGHSENGVRAVVTSTICGLRRRRWGNGFASVNGRCQPPLSNVFRGFELYSKYEKCC